MNEKERLTLLRKALRELKLTGQGYVQWSQDQKGGHWKEALAALGRLEKDFRPSPIPDLGPLWSGGKSVLLQDLTHATSGIPLYPAFDDAFNQGRVIVAPEAMEVIAPLTSSNPGEAFYAKGKSKIRYWLGHLDRSHPIGTKFQKGDAVGRVGANSIGGGPHVHCGINVELLFGEGKQLLHRTNYQHGGELIGKQLARLLA